MVQKQYKFEFTPLEDSYRATPVCKTLHEESASCQVDELRSKSAVTLLEETDVVELRPRQ